MRLASSAPCLPDMIGADGQPAWARRCGRIAALVLSASTAISFRISPRPWPRRGRAGLAANRRRIARILWQQWSPNWHFDEATFERTAVAHDNPDYVDVVIHSYRHRFGLADGDPYYADIQRRLAALPAITVPAITLDGDADGVAPATDGKLTAAKFTARRTHHIIPRAGHNLPQEEPEAFANAVMELIKA